MTTPQPPLPLYRRVVATGFRWCVYLLAWVCVALLVLWGVLHFWVVPHLDNFRPWIEKQASQALGTPVHIGTIVAKSNGLIPSVEFKEVQVQDAQGRVALQLPSVIAGVSLRSLLGLGLEQLYVDAPVLDVRRSKDGQLWIAGLLVSDSKQSSSAATDWVFSQRELVVRHGVVRWSDETRDAPPIALEDIDIVLRNSHRTHAMRLDLNPPQGWGERITLMGQFSHPRFEQHKGNWSRWSGQLYASAERLRLDDVRLYLDLGVDISKGSGALRAWVDLDKGNVTSATADVALADVVLKTAAGLDDLKFASASGRLGVQAEEKGATTYFTQGLAFDLRDGLHWPGGNVRLTVWQNDHPQAAGDHALAAADSVKPAVDIQSALTHANLSADQLDLAALSEIAQRLPLEVAVRETLRNLAPKGVVDTLEGTWHAPSAAAALPATSPTQSPTPPATQQAMRYSVKGTAHNLALAPCRSRNNSNCSVAGLRGAQLEFEANESTGKLSLVIRNGALLAPSIFDAGEIPIDQLSTQVQWLQSGNTVSVDIPQLQFANADAQGQAQIKWQSATAPSSAGMIDVRGTLSRAQIAAVSRYLPSDTTPELRHYLHDALQAGTASNVVFKVKGDMAKFPFTDPAQGEFRISADFKDIVYAFLPPSSAPKESLPWPTLTRLSGAFLLERDHLALDNVSGSVLDRSALQISKTQADITDVYNHPLVTVQANIRGPLADGIGMVNSSPLGDILEQALARSTASGVADYKLKLAIAPEHAEKTTVQGSITLNGNDFQVAPEVPRVSRLKGVVTFNETGFTVNGAQGYALGGDVRIDGGLHAPSSAAASAASSVVTNAAPSVSPNVLRLQGTVTAEGLRQAQELGFIANLGQYASGSATYSASVGVRSGQAELMVYSTLVGMGLTLPEPFAKPAQDSLPMRFEMGLLANANQGSTHAPDKLHDKLQLDIGQLAHLIYVRDLSGKQPRVVRGAIEVGLVGKESAPLAESGVTANLNMQRIDVDAWVAMLNTLFGGASLVPAADVGQLDAVAQSYLPSTLVVRANDILFQGRKLSNVLVGGGRQDLVWRANVEADQLGGYVEYHQPVGTALGRLYARLAHLNIGSSTAQDVESLLDEQPASIPAMDIVVEDFELFGKKLGRVDLEAINIGTGKAQDKSRAWQLNRCDITNPEATLTATGSWAAIAPAATEGAVSAPANPASLRQRRRTELNFKLDIRDAGALLERLAMPGLIANGKGKIEGTVMWQGSPLALDYPSMGGGFKIAVEEGQFLKVEPGVGRLLGVLNLQSLTNLLTLDFSSVVSQGFNFKSLAGDVTIEQGIAHTDKLVMKSSVATVTMDGEADIAKETQNINVVVVPDINAGGIAIAASAVNPLVALYTFMTSWVLRDPLNEANTKRYVVDGTWADPRVTVVEKEK